MATKDDENRLNAAAEVTDLSAPERREVARQSRPSAALIHETIRAEGQSELDRAASALLLSGLAAGLSMGLSLLVQGFLHAGLPAAPWRDLVVGWGYTVGFLVVVLGRQQLFTENTITPVLPLLHERSTQALWRLLRLWALVLVANIAGTWLVAAALAHGEIAPPEVRAAFQEISRHALGHSFWATAARGVAAGWIIALMVWLLPGADGQRLIVVLLMTYVVALADLAHVIAGSVDAFYLVQTGAADYGDYLVRFFAPTLLGNLVGGVTLVAVLNFGQVAPELSD
ncbi:formate/nitrite transporter family protein [Salinarimonas soli]|uniref:Formate/nitrite transporter family protein n=1 Tax=Salinarimonas soli TaxID=1638099 RepID=A0A5B2V960_9HYPH|nr:formate/nitrite transporter family protein [Salinarimonas soli]KAA2234879.1 formate/nitrite transporter family protein [Salinarimonas soli]